MPSFSNLKKLALNYLPVWLRRRRLRRLEGAIRRGLHIRRTAEFWDDTQTNETVYWLNAPSIREEVLKEVTGDPGLSWYHWQIKKRQSPFGRVLSFGDGYRMALDAHVIRGDVNEIVYCNISEGEGRRFAKVLAELAPNLAHNFLLADANRSDFASLGQFDSVINVGAFHHVKRLEHLLSSLAGSLKPGGLLYADEYIGPSKWRFEEKVIILLNQLMSTLPDDIICDRRPVTTREFSDLWKLGPDPSEAVGSGDLDRLLHEYFAVVEEHDFGGTLLFPLSMTIQLTPSRLKITPWITSDEAGQLMRWAVHHERELIRKGDIPSYYRYYVMTSR